jgi:hypothetical protein
VKHVRPSARGKTKRQRSVMTVLVLCRKQMARKACDLWGGRCGAVFIRRTTFWRA